MDYIALLGIIKNAQIKQNSFTMKLVRKKRLIMAETLVMIFMSPMIMTTLHIVLRTYLSIK